MTRVMPKKMQIASFKRLFPIWNKWREEECTDYDVTAERDNVDWDIIEEGANYHENLQMLKNNYPEYTWSKADIPQKMLEQYQAELDGRLEEDAEAVRLQHEALYEAEQQQEIPIPESVEPEEAELETLGVWKVEKTALGELHTIEAEIIPHTVKSKGKVYTYGRIQLTVPEDFLGHRAKISIFVPEIH
jgi:hypothetical protein